MAMESYYSTHGENCLSRIVGAHMMAASVQPRTRKRRPMSLAAMCAVVAILTIASIVLMALV